MERKKLTDGLVWREKPGGGFYPYIHFKKMHRGHHIRGSSKTSDPDLPTVQLVVLRKTIHEFLMDSFIAID